MSSPDRWPLTERVAAALAASRAEVLGLYAARSAEQAARAGRRGGLPDPSAAALLARLAELGQGPWPHPQDVVAAAAALLAGAAADPQRGPYVVLGEGAYRAAVAYGALDPGARELADLGACYLDVLAPPDQVAVDAASQRGGRLLVPAREFGLDEAGVATYRALRAQGHPPGRAGQMAALATAPPAP